MQKVGFVTYKDGPGLSKSDQLLVKPMMMLGYHILPAPWDDSLIDWTKFDVLVFQQAFLL